MIIVIRKCSYYHISLDGARCTGSDSINSEAATAIMSRTVHATSLMCFDTPSQLT